MDEFASDLNSFINMGDKGSDTIVFQIGSHSIKFGLASQLNPFVIPNTIAHLNKSPEEINKKQMDEKYPNYSNENNIKENEIFSSNINSLEQETLKKMSKLEQKLKLKSKSNLPKTYTNIKIYDSKNSETIISERKNNEFNPSTINPKKILSMAIDLNEDITENNFKWTNISERPLHIFGREALTISESKNYTLHKPIKYGYFNHELQNQNVVDDLTKIIEFCLTKILQLNKKTFPNFGIVLIIPDLFIKTQIKALVNIFLKTLNFKQIFLHLESIMSSFGAAMQSACVLDIGSDKVNVCCIDEGIVLEDSLIRKNFGGDDLTKILYKIATRKNSRNFFPEYLDMCSPYHFRIMEKLKETECEFPNLQNPTSNFIPKNSKIWVHKKGENTKVNNLTLSETAYLTPLALVNVELLSSIKDFKIPQINFFNDIYCDFYNDPEDVYEDLIKNINTEGNNNKKEDNNIGNNLSQNVNNNSGVKGKKRNNNNILPYNNTIKIPNIQNDNLSDEENFEKSKNETTENLEESNSK